MSENSIDAVVEISEVEVNDDIHVDSKVSEERVQGMMRKMQTTEEKIEHLTKVKDRWQLADNLMNTVGIITLAFWLTILTALVNILPENSISTSNLKISSSAVLTSLAGLFSLAKEGTVIRFTSNNKVKFQNQIRELEKKYNKCFLHVLFERARPDKKMTNEKLVRFYSISTSEETKE